MESERIRSCFSVLGFTFCEVEGSSGVQLVGFAPDGRVGIVEVESPEEERISLLLSVDRTSGARAWSAVCVSSLAQALGVDFTSWLGDHVRRRSCTRSWSVARRFEGRRVSAAFFPADTLLITVEAQGAVG